MSWQIHFKPCASGDKKLEGVDVFETYAPVVQWKTIQIILILEVLLGLKWSQGDVNVSFLHADSNKGENIYLGMSRRFNQKVNNGKNKVLKLEEKLYMV